MQTKENEQRNIILWMAVRNSYYIPFRVRDAIDTRVNNNTIDTRIVDDLEHCLVRGILSSAEKTILARKWHLDVIFELYNDITMGYIWQLDELLKTKEQRL